MELQELVDKLDAVRPIRKGWAARCPAHDDHKASLTVGVGKDQPVVIRCHAGCEVADILKALGVSWSDVMGEAHVEAVYDYVTTDGDVVFTVERWANPKTFRVRGSLPPPADRVPYQLPAIAWARSAGTPVYVVEGEKDVHRLMDAGHVATCNVSGAGSWLPHYGPYLAGCDVVIVADNDPPGRAHARLVAANVVDYADTVRLTIPRHGKDVSDLLAAGYDLDDLDDLSTTDDIPEYQASTVRVRKVEWAWRGYVALGKFTILEGDPGDGKSVLTLDLAARWSSGAPMPDGSTHGGPWPVMLVSAEDDMADTIVPRLTVAGARLDVVYLVPHGGAGDRPFEFVTDLDALDRRIIALGVRIVVFDPLTAFLSSGTDTHNDMQVRKALWPLKGVAERCRAAVLGVRHLNKGSAGVKAVYRGNGSIAFTGAARVALLVAPDPEDPAGRVMATVKNNIGPKAPTLRYLVESTPDGTMPFLTWRGPSTTDAQTALDGPQRHGSDGDGETQSRKRAREYECQFLVDTLKEGPMAWADIVQLGKGEGFSARTLVRARADLGLIKAAGSHGQADTHWSLPDAMATSDGTPSGQLATDLRPSTGGVNGWSNGQMGSDGDDTLTDEDRRKRVDEAPAACEVCGTDTHILRCYGPWWTVRCIDHDPENYRA